MNLNHRFNPEAARNLDIQKATTIQLVEWYHDALRTLVKDEDELQHYSEAERRHLVREFRADIRFELKARKKAENTRRVIVHRFSTSRAVRFQPVDKFRSPF